MRTGEGRRKRGHTSGLRPTRSIRNQGMKLARKNHSCRKPDMSAERWLLSPALMNNVLE